MSNDTLKAWVQASRPQFFIATIIPLLMGGILAAQAGHWDTTTWLVILLASFLVHLNTNLANDYFEYYTGADEGNSIGGSRVLQQGQITLKQLLAVMVLFYFLALLCGLWLLWQTGLWILIPIMLFSFFSSVFYTAPPIRYGYRGLGELFVGLNMGPIMVAGTAYTMTGDFTIRSLMLSLPIAILVALILYYQSLSDIDDDRAIGKNTLAVKLGTERILAGFTAFVVLHFIIIAFLVMMDYISPLAFVTVATLPILFSTFNRIKNTDDLQVLHDQGGGVRKYYLLNGLILIAVLAIKG